MKAIKIEIDRTILAGIKIGLAIIIITLLAACQSVSSGIPYIPKKSIETKTSEIKLVSLLDAFKAALGALGKIVKIQ